MGRLHASATWSAYLLASTLVFGGSPAVHAAPPELAPRADQPCLLLLADEGELAFPIERAIRTELNDVEVALDVMPMVQAHDLRDRIGVAEQEVATRGALGAVWLEVGDHELVVYLVVADAGMVRRPIAGESQDARVEAAAIVIRHFTTELLEGRSIGLIHLDDDSDPAPELAPESDREREPEIEGPRQPDVPQREPEQRPWRLGERGRLRIQVGYLGQAWAPQRRWSSGVELDLEWRMRIGVHVGASYTVIPRHSDHVAHSSHTRVAEVEVRRFPPALILGYQHVWDRAHVALDAQVRLIGEIVERRAEDAAEGDAIAIVPRLVLAPAIEPRLQLDWLFRPPLSLNLAIGLRVNTIDYTYGLDIEDSTGSAVEHREYLTPFVVAPTLQIGLGVFL
ncbi:hypothetical protein ACNOYE_35865 [Nannocystaceae bacterium ST9]